MELKELTADHPRARGSQDGGDGAAGVCSQGGKVKGEANEQDSSPNRTEYPAQHLPRET